MDLRVVDNDGEKFVSVRDLRAMLDRATRVLAVGGLVGLADSNQALGAAVFADTLDKELGRL